MNGSVRTWIPATLVALVVAALIGAGAYFALNRANSTSKAGTSPSADIHSKEAVMAAVQHYYDVENTARRTGAIDPMSSVTGGPGTPAFENLRTFLADQAKKGHRSTSVSDRITDWAITLDGDSADASYVLVQVGHDIDASSGQPVEADMTTPRTHYRAAMRLRDRVWIMFDRQLIGRDSA